MHQIDTNRVVAMMQCQACLSFILAIANRQTQMNHVVYYYQEHYPMGLPNDKTPDEIPAEIQSEFKEAIRCEWLRAYRACVLMCRRSLQISCDKELLEVLDHEPTEADKKQNSRKDLFTQIDELKEKGRITETLQKMAHRIRLLGKRGAHGDYSDIDATIGETDAKQALTFMRHYFDHVYVLPKQLEDKGPTAQSSKASGT